MQSTASHTDVEALTPEQTLKLKMKHVKIDVAATSQLPYRVVRRRNGVILGSFETRPRAEHFIVEMTLKTIGVK